MRINIEMVESKLKSEKYLPFERVTRGRVVISCGGSDFLGGGHCPPSDPQMTPL